MAGHSPGSWQEAECPQFCSLLPQDAEGQQYPNLHVWRAVLRSELLLGTGCQNRTLYSVGVRPTPLSLVR